jgi:hypothetical protein
MDQSQDVLGAGQALELLHADVGQPDPSRKLVGDQLRSGPRKQDLATPRKGAQPSRPIQRLSVVAALAQLGLPRVQRHPGGQDQAGWPGFGGQCLLQPQGGVYGVTRPPKDRQRGVPLALGLDQAASVGGHGRLDQRLMPGERSPHRGPVQLPELGGTFAVGQQEGDDAVRELDRWLRHGMMAGPYRTVSPFDHAGSSFVMAHQTMVTHLGERPE